MRFYNKTFHVAILISLMVNYSFGQAVKEPTFASPNAASLGKYGDIPVSYHTGVPDISIPIYTVQEGSLSLPVSISYHSSGIKVSETASWVGLGWSLNAGGMITRTVNGGPDEGMTGSMPGALSPYVGWGWYKDQGIPTEIIACSSRPLSIEGPVAGTYPSWQGCRAIYYEAAKGYIDTEPDLYTFNFGGVSGKFFFDASRKVHMIPESDFHIEAINSPSYFYAWKIIATDGTKYFFGGTATEISCSDPSGLNGSKQASSSTTWYLYRVESANGEDWITLNYVDDKYSFGNRAGHSVTFTEFGSGAGTLIGDYDDASLILSASTVDGKRLTQITTSSGQTIIDFVPSSAAREDVTFYNSSGLYNVESANTTSKSLQSINITTGSKCKKFELSQDYYSSADCTGCSGASWYGSSYDKKRLRLNWIRESTCDGAELMPKYEFTYNSTALPRRYSLARDTWEYYNGVEDNHGLLEDFVNPVLGISMTYNTGDLRTVNEGWAKAGILTMVKYPTGGTSEFVYESHREEDTSPIVGGLRIKTLTTTDGMGNSMTKNFTYSSGKVFYTPESYSYQYPNNNDNFTGASLGVLDFGIQHLSMPFPPMWASHGYHIGYGQVKVYETGNGSTIYNFRNTTPTVINPAMYPLKPVVAIVSTSEQTLEDTRNNANVSIASKSSSSSMIGTPPPAVQGRRVALVSCLNCGGSGNNDYGIWMDYYIDTYRYNPVTKGEVRDGITTQTTLTYDAVPKHNNPKTVETTDSKGIVHRTEYTYASDAGSGAPASMYTPTDANFKNMLGAVIEQRSYVNGSITSKSSSQYTQRQSALLLTSSKTYPSGTADFIENQYQYNDNFNIVNILKSNGVNGAYQWGYNNSLPLAEVKNAQNTKYTVYTNVTATTGISLGGVTPQSTNKTFTVDYTGTVTLKFGMTANPTFTTYLDYSWTYAGNTYAGTITVTKNQSCNYDWVVFNNVPPGEYTMALTLRTAPSGNSVGGCGEIVYPDIISSISGITEFFYEGFEEGTYATTSPHTGKQYYSGDYTTTFTMPNSRTYTIEYWYLNGSAWEYASAAYTNGMTLTLGSAIDDVRIYPSDALMKSYNYDPGLGITSVIEENGRVMYYEYDNFGRLARIKNEQGGIEKQYTYNYKTN